MDNYNITSEGAPRAQGRGGEGAGNRLAASGRNLGNLVDYVPPPAGFRGAQ